MKNFFFKHDCNHRYHTKQQKIVGSLILHYSTTKYEKFKAIRVLKQSHGEVKETS